MGLKKRVWRGWLGGCVFLWTSGLVSASTIAALPPLPTDSLSIEWHYAHYMQRLDAIELQSLPLLSQSDCRLLDLESETYRYYRLLHSRTIPYDLAGKMAQKRQIIDHKRSFIDSLYYVQALQALNANPPDEALAEKSIEMALTHHRFFVRAVCLRWSRLQREAEKTGKWTACLDYARATLSPLGWHEKVQDLGQTLYLKLLSSIEALIKDGLYQDALVLYGQMKQYLRPETASYYQPRRESEMIHTAYQGIFEAYYKVAEKAYQRGLYQQAQGQALAAHDYYKQHGRYMDGVDKSLLLLKKIGLDYRRFMLYADEDEQAYYAAMTDTIALHTGLDFAPETATVTEHAAVAVITPTEVITPTTTKPEAKTEMIAAAAEPVVTPVAEEKPVLVVKTATVEPMATPIVEEKPVLVAEAVKPVEAPATKPIEPQVIATEPVKVETRPTVVEKPMTKPIVTESIVTELAKVETKSTVVEKPMAAAVAEPKPEPEPIKQPKWSLAYAQKQWDIYIEQARLHHAKRQFAAAREAYLTGDSIRRAYPIRVSSGFEAERAQNDRACVEQWLNKAQYRLWKNDWAQSDSLYRRALAVVEQTPIEERTTLYGLIDAFETKKAQLWCRHQQQLWQEKLKALQSQLALGRVSEVERQLSDLDQVRFEVQTQGPTNEAVCLLDTARLDSLRRQAHHLSAYHRLLLAAQTALTAADTMAFIRGCQEAEAYFNTHHMAAFTAPITPLLERLTLEQNLPMMTVYLLTCIEDGHLDEADFAAAFLKASRALPSKIEKRLNTAKKAAQKAAKSARVADKISPSRPTKKPLYPLFIRPQISGSFAELRRTHYHGGLDFRTQQRTGLRIRSVQDGEIYKIGLSATGYGKVLYVRHAEGYVSVYAHLSRFHPKVEKMLRELHISLPQKGDTTTYMLTDWTLPVKRGEVIARSGNTGSSGGPHLHFEWRRGENEDSAMLLNPSLYTWKIKDHTPPQLKTLAVYPLDADSRADSQPFPQYYRLGKAANTTTNAATEPLGIGAPLPDTCYVKGRVCFGIEALDKIEKMKFHYGLYALTFFVNYDTLAHYQFDSIPLRYSGSINSHIDTVYYKAHKGRIELSRVGADTLPYSPYTRYKNDGCLSVTPGRLYRLEIIAKDFNGNTSSARLLLLGKDGRRTVLTPVFNDMGAPSR